MGRWIRENVRFLVGLGIVGGWVEITGSMLHAGQLMSLDEEWIGSAG